jgi:hypothetical protein
VLAITPADVLAGELAFTGVEIFILFITNPITARIKKTETKITLVFINFYILTIHLDII